MKKLLKNISLKSNFILASILIALGTCLICSSTVKAETPKTKGKFNVVIDAGHGGLDHGVIANGLREKDINLGVAKKLQELINKKMKNVNVIMTRDNDSFLSLQKRADMANDINADLFISIHTNSLDKTNSNRSTVSGVSVFVLGDGKDESNFNVARMENAVIENEDDKNTSYASFDPSKDEYAAMMGGKQPPYSQESYNFARLAQAELVKTAGRNNRNVKQAPLYVLYACSRPSVLVEMDYICNPEIAKFLGTASGQEKIALSLYKALESYINGNTAILEETKTENVKEPASKVTTQNNVSATNNNNNNNNNTASSNTASSQTRPATTTYKVITNKEAEKQRKEEEKKRKEEEKKRKEEEKKRKEEEKKAKKNGNKNIPAQTVQNTPSAESTDDTEAGVLADCGNRTERHHINSSNNNKKNNPRKRRSAISKQESDRRNVETASIEIYEESSYLIKVERVNGGASSSQATVASNESSKKDQGKSNNTDKKNEKPRTSIVNKNNQSSAGKPNNSSSAKTNSKNNTGDAQATASASVASDSKTTSQTSTGTNSTTGNKVTTEQKTPRPVTTVPVKPGEKYYTIMLMKTDVKYKIDDPVFKDYQPIEMFVENGKYVYTYGRSKSSREIHQIHMELAHDFPGSYVIYR